MTKKTIEDVYKELMRNAVNFTSIAKQGNVITVTKDSHMTCTKGTISYNGKEFLVEVKGEMTILNLILTLVLAGVGLLTIVCLPVALIPLVYHFVTKTEKIKKLRVLLQSAVE